MSSENIIEDLQPFDGEVDIEKLLDHIEGFISQHVILPDGASVAITLWCLATYNINNFRIYPKLSITSPEKRCGKSTVLDLVEAFSYKSVMTSNISMAALYRMIEEYQPTLIIDEADTFIAGNNREMVGIINSGHAKRKAFTTRCVGDNHDPKSFSTWTPMVLASINKLQSTIVDRSVNISLRRKTKNESVKRIKHDFYEVAEIVRQSLLKWSIENENNLTSDQIEPKNLGNDRAVDNWLPLFTIAKLVSDNWFKKCELAYRLLNVYDDEPSLSTQLLGDIRNIFGSHGNNKISSSELISKLIEFEDHPWGQLRNGRPISQVCLARMLRSYGIKPKGIRYNGRTPRGYELRQFNDSFDRYL